MTYYRVIEPIVIAFLDSREQFDLLIEPDEFIGFDGKSVYLRDQTNEKDIESISGTWVIHYWLQSKKIEESF